MKSFTEIVAAFAALDERTRTAVEWAIEYTHGTLQDPNYNEDWAGDHVRDYFIEIGEAVYYTLYPAEPEPEKLPIEPLKLAPGEIGFYCRKCEEAHRFIERNGALVCEKCGAVRNGVTSTIKRK